MKKLLSVLAAIGLTATSATTVVACGTSKSDNGNHDAKHSQYAAAIQNESLVYSKSLLLDKQFGLDADSANTTMKLGSSADFDPITSDQAKALDANGTRGLANQPIQHIIDIINGLIKTFSPNTAPISVDAKTMKTIGDIAQKAPDFINKNGVDGVMKALPGLIQAVFVPLIGTTNIGGETADFIGSKTYYFLKLLLGNLNLKEHIKDMLTEAKAANATTDISWFINQGTIAFKQLTEHVFSKYRDADKKDSALSKFFGQEILTKLLNKQEIKFDSSWFDFAHIGLWSLDITYWIGTIVSSLVIQFGLYQPLDGSNELEKPIKNQQDSINAKQADVNQKQSELDAKTKEINDKNDEIKKEKDPDKKKELQQELADLKKEQNKLKADLKTLQSDLVKLQEDLDPLIANYFKVQDAKVVSSDDKGNITVDGQPADLSLDKVFGTIFDDLTNADKNSYGILKLTNIFFHDVTDKDGNAVNNPFLDQVMFMIVDSLKFTDYQVVVNEHIEIPILNAIDINMNFNLKDLFVPGEHIHITDALGMELYIGTEGNGIMDTYHDRLLPLAKAILLNQTNNSNNLKDAFLGALGKKGDNCVLYGDNKQGAKTPLGDNFMIKNVAWSMINPLLQNMIYNIFYTNDQPNSLANLPGGDKNTKPVAVTINNAVTNFKIGDTTIDLTIFRKLISLDTLIKAGSILIVANPYQDPTYTGKNPQSLAEQLLANLQNDKMWATFLGYVTGADKDAEIKAGTDGWTSDDVYIRPNSFIGVFFEDIYQASTNADATVKDSKGNTIVDVSKLAKNKVDGSKSAMIDKMLTDFGQGCIPEDISSITNLVNNSDDWTIDKLNYQKASDDSIHEMDYELTLKTSDTNVTYKITFERSSWNSKFIYKSISKVN